MKNLFALFLLLQIVSGMNGAYAYSARDVEAYIAKHKDIALANEKQYGIPAPIILAQGILESGAGTSGLTLASNNHFGIKAGSSWRGSVHRAWDDESQKSKFRCYRSALESYQDHARLLTRMACYRPLFAINIYDYRGWAFGLKKAGYATAPNYAQALIGIIDHYKLYAINGGAKLRPGKTVVITKYIDVTKPVFDEQDVLAEAEVTEEEAIIVDAMRKYAVEINDIRCTVLQPGENISSIARKYDISPAKLLEFNEVALEKQIKEGDVVFLAKKKRKYEGTQDFYIAKEGEMLHQVSQQFGIQVRSLAKLNNLTEYARLKAGERISLK